MSHYTFNSTYRPKTLGSIPQELLGAILTHNVHLKTVQLGNLSNHADSSNGCATKRTCRHALCPYVQTQQAENVTSSHTVEWHVIAWEGET